MYFLASEACDQYTCIHFCDLFHVIFQALTRYQMLFRHLFYCKHVERQLCKYVHHLYVLMFYICHK